jgi:septum formation protein
MTAHHDATSTKIILASASPRRAEILRAAGFNFEIAASNIDESPLPNEQPENMVMRLALAKARSVASKRKSQQKDIVLAADTIVVIGGQVLGKPNTPDRSREMLHELNGREHAVITGVALLALPSQRFLVAVETTRVWFSKMSDREIEEYVLTGEPLDKAGAYAIQGLASRFIPRIEGCYFNVVGLPIARVWAMLQQLSEA